MELLKPTPFLMLMVVYSLVWLVPGGRAVEKEPPSAPNQQAAAADGVRVVALLAPLPFFTPLLPPLKHPLLQAPVVHRVPVRAGPPVPLAGVDELRRAWQLLPLVLLPVLLLLVPPLRRVPPRLPQPPLQRRVRPLPPVALTVARLRVQVPQRLVVAVAPRLPTMQLPLVVPRPLTLATRLRPVRELVRRLPHRVLVPDLRE